MHIPTTSGFRLIHGKKTSLISFWFSFNILYNSSAFNWGPQRSTSKPPRRPIDMKTIAKLMALCMLLGTLAIAQDAPKPATDQAAPAADANKAPAADSKEKKAKKEKKSKKDKKKDDAAAAPSDKK
jgi:hypothetical protein